MGGLTRGSPAFFINCAFCGNKYKILPVYFKRAKTHCCSKECQDKLAKGKYRNRTKHRCIRCGKEFWSRDAWTKNRRGGGDYCNIKCRWRLKPKFTHNQHQSAQHAVARALKKGILIKLPCKICNSLLVEAHHYLGYNKIHWLDVRWLCDKHHVLEHECLRKQGIRLG